jgi:hypothetical protein
MLAENEDRRQAMATAALTCARLATWTAYRKNRVAHLRRHLENF